MPIKRQAKLSREDIIEKYGLKAQGLGREQIVRPEEIGFIFWIGSFLQCSIRNGYDWPLKEQVLIQWAVLTQTRQLFEWKFTAVKDYITETYMDDHLSQNRRFLWLRETSTFGIQIFKTRYESKISQKKPILIIIWTILIWFLNQLIDFNKWIRN